MILDDGATNGQSDPHTVALGGVERIEDSIDIVGCKTYTRICNAQTHGIVRVLFSFDRQLSRTSINTAHCV